jgi:hypothetical protein
MLVDNSSPGLSDSCIVVLILSEDTFGVKIDVVNTSSVEVELVSLGLDAVGIEASGCDVSPMSPVCSLGVSVS